MPEMHPDLIRAPGQRPRFQQCRAVVIPFHDVEFRTCVLTRFFIHGARPEFA